MEVGLVGEEVPGRDAAQGIVPLELFDEQLDPGALVVEAPEVEGLQREIRDEDLVMVLAQLEECQLGGRLFGLEATDHDEPIGMRPASRLVAELGHLDPSTGTHIPQARQFGFDGAGQAGDDHKASLVRLQPLDQLVVVKPFVRADDHQPDPGRDLREAGGKEVERPAGRMGVPGPQLAMPEVLAAALEAEQRVIRWSPPLDRVVANLGLLLLAVEHEHGRVDIEDQSRWRAWSRGHTHEEAIVQPAQLGQRRWRHAQQESPQRGRIWIGVQPREVLEHAVLPQQLSRLDPFESQDHRVQQGEQHLAPAVAVVPLDQADIRGHRVLEPDPREKPMQKIDTTVVGQALGPERDSKIPWSFWHHSEPYPRGSIHCNKGNPSPTV